MERVIREIEEVLDLEQCKKILLEWVKVRKGVGTVLGSSVISESVSVFQDGVLVEIKERVS